MEKPNNGGGAANINEQEKWLKLYELAHGEEQHFSGEHHKRLNFFVGIASALIAATIGGMLQVKAGWQYLLLIPGPLMAIVVARLGIKACIRIYQRAFEAVTKKAKIEALLGLDVPPRVATQDQKWWLTEQYIPQRYLRDRDALTGCQQQCSEAWVSHLIKHGPYSKIALYLQVAFVIAAVLVTGLLIYLWVSNTVPTVR